MKLTREDFYFKIVSHELVYSHVNTKDKIGRDVLEFFHANEFVRGLFIIDEFCSQ